MLGTAAGREIERPGKERSLDDCLCPMASFLWRRHSYLSFVHGSSRSTARTGT
jgi:hypothetical protein